MSAGSLADRPVARGIRSVSFLHSRPLSLSDPPHCWESGPPATRRHPPPPTPARPPAPSGPSAMAGPAFQAIQGPKPALRFGAPMGEADSRIPGSCGHFGPSETARQGGNPCSGRAAVGTLRWHRRMRMKTLRHSRAVQFKALIGRLHIVQRASRIRAVNCRHPTCDPCR